MTKANPWSAETEALITAIEARDAAMRLGTPYTERVNGEWCVVVPIADSIARRTFGLPAWTREQAEAECASIAAEIAERQAHVISLDAIAAGLHLLDAAKEAGRPYRHGPFNRVCDARGLARRMLAAAQRAA